MPREGLRSQYNAPEELSLTNDNPSRNYYYCIYNIKFSKRINGVFKRTRGHPIQAIVAITPSLNKALGLVLFVIFDSLSNSGMCFPRDVSDNLPSYLIYNVSVAMPTYHNKGMFRPVEAMEV